MSILALEYPFTHKLRISADLWMEIDAGTKTLHERDSPALAVRYSTRTRTPPERGENRTDEDPNQGGQQRGVGSHKRPGTGVRGAATAPIGGRVHRE